MATPSRPMMRMVARAAAASARQRAAAAARQRSARSGYRSESSMLTIKDVEAVVDKCLKNREIGASRSASVRSGLRNAVTICTSGVVTALMYAYIEKSLEAARKDMMLLMYQREEAKERAREVTIEPVQPKKFLGFFPY